MTLKDKFRQNLTGHLSEEKTMVDVVIAERIADEYAIQFAVWYKNYSYKGFKSDEELLILFKKEMGL